MGYECYIIHVSLKQYILKHAYMLFERLFDKSFKRLHEKKWTEKEVIKEMLQHLEWQT